MLGHDAGLNDPAVLVRVDAGDGGDELGGGGRGGGVGIATTSTAIGRAALGSAAAANVRLLGRSGRLVLGGLKPAVTHGLSGVCEESRRGDEPLCCCAEK